MSRRKDLDSLPRLNPKAIRAARLRAGETHASVAAAVGVTIGAVSRWERGLIAQIGPERLASLAAFLGVEPRKLEKIPQGNKG